MKSPKSPKSVPAVRGELKEALIQQHPLLATIDKGLGWILILIPVTVETVTLGITCLRLVDGVSPADLMLVCGAMCSFFLSLLALLLWHSFCYYDPRVRNIMKKKTKLTPEGFMRIGFVPIPAAASVGLLMFCTSCFVSPAAMTPGSFLTIGSPGSPGAGVYLPWLPEMTCTASSIEEPDYLTRWGARFDRDGPATLGAIAIQAVIDPIQSMISFLSGKHRQDLISDVAIPGSCFKTLSEFGKDAVIANGKDKIISNLAHPEGDPNRICMYECVNWKTIDFKTVLTQLGAITAGAAIVVQLTESVSSRLGLATISGATKPAELDALFKKTGPNVLARRLFKPLQASMTGAAFPIVAIGILLKWIIVIKVDADGFNTVDYYTTYSLVYSVLLVTLMRIWHPFECRPQLYTKKIWANGVDSFIVENETLAKWEGVYGEGEIEVIRKIGEKLTLVKIDLYMWMHLRGKERADLLIKRCRRPEEVEGNDVKVKTLTQTTVRVKHHVTFKGGQITSEKEVTLPADQELTLKSWKDEDIAKCEVTLAGTKEKVTLDKHEILEASEEWEALAKEHLFSHAALQEELL